MNRWKLAVPLIAGLASLYATGCVTEERVVVRKHRPAPVRIRQAPPPDEVEVVPTATRANYAWTRGHWHWNGSRYVWIGGRYRAQRTGVRWVPAHYENRGGEYYYVEEHWAGY